MMTNDGGMRCIVQGTSVQGKTRRAIDGTAKYGEGIVVSFVWQLQMKLKWSVERSTTSGGSGAMLLQQIHFNRHRRSAVAVGGYSLHSASGAEGRT